MRAQPVAEGRGRLPGGVLGPRGLVTIAVGVGVGVGVGVEVGVGVGVRRAPGDLHVGSTLAAAAHRLDLEGRLAVGVELHRRDVPAIGLVERGAEVVLARVVVDGGVGAVDVLAAHLGDVCGELLLDLQRGLEPAGRLVLHGRRRLLPLRLLRDCDLRARRPPAVTVTVWRDLAVVSGLDLE